MAVFKGSNAAIYLASGTPVAFLDEATTADSERKIYTITNATKRFWDPATAVVVERSTDGGTTWNTVPTSEYAVQYPGGKIRFAAVQAAGTLIRVDGAYIPVSLLGEAKEWSLDPEADNVETTTFGKTWKEFTQVLKGASGSLSKWWIDSFFLTNLGGRLGLELQIEAGKVYQMYARFTSDSISAAVDGLIEESLDFTADGQVYY